jgi:hypothetical protein
MNWLASGGYVQWRWTEEIQREEWSRFAVVRKARGWLLL